ncbi:MAG TPA: hypothetical protein VH596_12520 [Terriglobales bacterium]|jgi:hypothetical protein
MPVLTKLVQIAVKPIPKTLTPKAHAIVDYISVGACLMAAASFWGRNKRASVAALITGGGTLLLALLTDYPGGVKKVIKFRTHREIDFGLAAMTATMPDFFAFKDDHERKFFLAEGVLISAVNEMTQLPGPQRILQQNRAA